MLRITVFLITMLPALTVRSENDPSAAAKEYQKLVDEFAVDGGTRAFAKRFLAFAEKYPKDPAAVDALLWVVKKIRGRPDTDAALMLLSEKHVQSKELGSACKIIVDSRSAKAEPLLRDLLEKSPHKDVRAHAAYYLAALLDLEANIVDQLKAKPDLAPRVLQYYGKEYGKHLASLDFDKLEQQRIAICEQLLKSFADAEIENTKIGDFARKRLFHIRNLSLGKLAPEIDGEDIAGEVFKLSDYRGKVVMLTFWGHW